MPASPDRYEPLPSLLELPSHLVRKLPPGGRRLVGGAGVLVVIAIVVGLVVALPHIHAGQQADQARQDRLDAAHRAALEARYAREARPHRGTGPAARDLAALTPRRRLQAGLEAAVLTDARVRAQRGELRGGYREATCFH